MTVSLGQYFKQKILCPFDESVDVGNGIYAFFLLIFTDKAFLVGFLQFFCENSHLITF